MNRALLISASLFLAACSSNAPKAGPAAESKTPAGLESLVGARGSSGEEGLKQAGYEYRNTSKTADTSIMHWRGKDGACVEVITKDGRYASINAVDPGKCAGENNEVAASGNPAALRTVCGVIVGGKPTRFICEVVENRQGTTILRLPDTTLKLTWQPGNKILFVQDDMAPVSLKYAEAEGETNWVVDQRTFFYISNPDAAALEVKNFK